MPFIQPLYSPPVKPMPALLSRHGPTRKACLKVVTTSRHSVKTPTSRPKHSYPPFRPPDMKNPSIQSILQNWKNDQPRCASQKRKHRNRDRTQMWGRSTTTSDQEFIRPRTIRLQAIYRNGHMLDPEMERHRLMHSSQFAAEGSAGNTSPGTPQSRSIWKASCDVTSMWFSQ
jgi:hypothetical protein